MSITIDHEVGDFQQPRGPLCSMDADPDSQREQFGRAERPVIERDSERTNSPLSLRPELDRFHELTSLFGGEALSLDGRGRAFTPVTEAYSEAPAGRFEKVGQLIPGPSELGMVLPPRERESKPAGNSPNESGFSVTAGIEVVPVWDLNAPTQDCLRHFDQYYAEKLGREYRDATIFCAGSFAYIRHRGTGTIY